MKLPAEPEAQRQHDARSTNDRGEGAKDPGVATTMFNLSGSAYAATAAQAAITAAAQLEALRSCVQVSASSALRTGL
jgi:hypothetical protein